MTLYIYIHAYIFKWIDKETIFKRYIFKKDKGSPFS